MGWYFICYYLNVNHTNWNPISAFNKLLASTLPIFSLSIILRADRPMWRGSFRSFFYLESLSIKYSKNNILVRVLFGCIPVSYGRRAKPSRLNIGTVGFMLWSTVASIVQFNEEWRHKYTFHFPPNGEPHSKCDSLV